MNEPDIQESRRVHWFGLKIILFKFDICWSSFLFPLSSCISIFPLVYSTAKYSPLTPLFGCISLSRPCEMLPRAIYCRRHMSLAFSVNNSLSVYLVYLIIFILIGRICKLLFYHIKPVFVFDGGCPAIKRRTAVGLYNNRLYIVELYIQKKISFILL